jgi:hypothetical protein
MEGHLFGSGATTMCAIRLTEPSGLAPSGSTVGYFCDRRSWWWSLGDSNS